MRNSSTILYRNARNAVTSVELKTIQSLQVTDSSTIPTQSTITGEYRNQFVTKAPLRVTFTTWLEDDPNGDTDNTVKEILDQFVYLRDHRVLFNLTTSHYEQDSKFLSDLAIEKFDWERASERRNRLVVKVNCLQIKLINLKWKEASSVEIFGTNIFANEGTGITQTTFEARSIIEDFMLEEGVWTKAVNAMKTAANLASGGSASKDLEIKSNDYEALVSGNKSLPVNVQVYNQLKDKIAFSDRSFYFRLASPIDLSIGNRTYNCKNSFQSCYGNVSPTDKSYNVDFLSLTVTTKKNEGSLVSNIPLPLLFGTEYVNALLGIFGKPIIVQSIQQVLAGITDNYNTTKFPYDFADTYPNYQISRTFDSIASLSDLSDFVWTNRDTLTTDIKTISNGNIVLDQTGLFVQSYQISQRYNFTCQFGDSFKETLVPDGGLKIVSYKLTTSANGLKPTIGNNQAIWDAHFMSNSGLSEPLGHTVASSIYSVSVVFILLGSMLQIYLFSPCFNKDFVMYKT
jgi:hypothetical protein